jgi:ornithine cyclodeaminase
LDKQKVEFLYLSEPDMLKAGVLDVEKCVGVMDETFRLLGHGDYLMGGHDGNSHGCMLWYPKESPFSNMPLEGPDRRYMAMPAYLGGRFNVCGTKWYGSNILNRERGLPRSVLMVSLNDADTGAPLAIMSGNLLSAAETAGIAGEWSDDIHISLKEKSAWAEAAVKKETLKKRSAKKYGIAGH